MIKVPGTLDGVAAIEELIYRGVQVNVTLLFSLPQWREVRYAYVRALERRLADGLDLRVASVASFFISRIDGKANTRLPAELHNRIGVASAQLAYVAYRRLLDTGRWQRLARAGARAQRLLWASTSAKDPTLPETYYVRLLAAPRTVNTMPAATLLAFAASGTVDEAMRPDRNDAQSYLERAAAHGLELEALGEELQEEGDVAFAEAFDRLLDCIRRKSAALQPDGRPRLSQPLITHPPVRESTTKTAPPVHIPAAGPVLP